eukprot:COSAG04_NODE_6601_length_1296_cov_2.310777_1_plen_88_part_10
MSHAGKEGLGRAHLLHGAARRVALDPDPPLVGAVPARPARLAARLPALKPGAVAAFLEGEEPAGVAAGLQPPYLRSRRERGRRVLAAQ